MIGANYEGLVSRSSDHSPSIIMLATILVTLLGSAESSLVKRSAQQAVFGDYLLLYKSRPGLFVSHLDMTLSHTRRERMIRSIRTII